MEPQELQKESDFIERNIEFTRLAFGIADVEERSLPAESEDVSAADIEENQDDHRQHPPVEPRTLQRRFRQLQQIRPYYEFDDVDVDRYELESGSGGVVMVAPGRSPRTASPAAEAPGRTATCSTRTGTARWPAGSTG